MSELIFTKVLQSLDLFKSIGRRNQMFLPGVHGVAKDSQNGHSDLSVAAKRMSFSANESSKSTEQAEIILQLSRN